MRFRWRLALFGAGVAALVMLAFGLALVGIAERAGPEDQAKRLAEAAGVFASELDGAEIEALEGFPGLGSVDVASSFDTAVLFATESGGVIGGTALDGDVPLTLRDCCEDIFDLDTSAVAGTRDGIELRIASSPYRAADGTAMAAIVVQQTAAVAQQLDGIRAVVWLAAIIAFVIALIASWLVSGRALRPLRSLASTADEIRATGDLSRRLPSAESKDELGRITNSFNDMMSQLESSQRDLATALDAQRRFVADASHELRSPLTTIRNNAEFLTERSDIAPKDRTEALADISAEASRMSVLVEDLLALARGESLEQRGPVALEDLVEAEADRLRKAGEAVDVHIERATVEGDHTALERLLRILTNNALHHGSGPLTLRCGNRRDTSFFGVADRGPGFPTDDLVSVFDRFYRADPARTRTGTGLGLSIANQIALAHGGRMVAANRPGGGAVVEAELPPAR